MKKLNKSDYILIGVIVVLGIILLLVVNLNDNKESLENDSNVQKYMIVNNTSTFFTIESCANRYINSLMNKNVDELMILIDNDYKNNNAITRDNIISKLENLNGMYSLKAKSIKYIEIDDYQIKYYVYGLLKQEIINEYDYGKDYYLIVNVDKKNNLFSVEPYDGKIFKEAL